MDETASENIFAGGGEMGALMRQRMLSVENNWSATSLGSPASWPASLKSAVSLCLNAPAAMFIWWGKDLTLLYNDAGRDLLGDRHPQSLGAPGEPLFAAGTGQTGFSQIWQMVGPQLSSVFETGIAAFDTSPVAAIAISTETQYTYSSSPIFTEGGVVGGVLTLILEALSPSQAELKTARGQLDTALAAGAIHLWRWQIREDLVFVSSACADLFGMSPELAAAGLPVADYLAAIHPDDRERVTAAIRQAIETGEEYSSEYRICIPGRETRWLAARGRVEYNSGGSDEGSAAAISFVGALADVTERKRSEEALRLSEEKLRSFFEADLVGILFGDIYGNIHEANDEFLRIVGYSQAEVHSGQLDWVNITPPEYLYLDEIGISEARSTGSCTPYEKEYVRQDGSRVPVLVGYILTGERREESVAFILDLSDRKQTQESLRLSEERYRVLTSTLTSIVWTANAAGEFGTPQPEWEAYTGQSWEAHRGLGWAKALHPDNEKPVLIAQSGEGELKSLYLSEGRIWHAASGEYRYFEARGVPLLNADGSVREWIGNVTDVHDRKRIEAEREQLLQGEQAAREAAERANRIKDEFLMVVSHELRSPLNPILGWSQLLQRGKLSAERTAFALATIERNAQLQVQLIGDLLDISQILRGKMSLEETRVDLAQVIAAALETVRLSAESKSIQIEIISSPCAVVGDAGRLQQVIWNLLSNAVKFTPEGGKITVTLAAVGRSARICVADTGKGISRDFLPYVFEHFRQEDYSTTRQFGGLGLGLAIVRQLTEMHGGTVAVESPGEDQGSTFTVHIPLATRPDESPATVSPAARHKLDSIHILVVDDEPDSREITTFALEQAHATVTTVTSGAEALAAMTQAVPHIIISDIGMPEIDGYSLMRQIRALSAEQGGAVAAIALTAYAGEIDYKQAIAAGFQRHLTKPVDPDDLVKIVGELLTSRARDD
jgi:PAS domain S-box-containing protein